MALLDDLLIEKKNKLIKKDNDKKEIIIKIKDEEKNIDDEYIKKLFDKNYIFTKYNEDESYCNNIKNNALKDVINKFGEIEV